MKAVLNPGAKINLGLRVLRKREDGYHDIISVFQEISLEDILEIEAGKGERSIRLECSGNLPRGPDNLAWQAAETIMDATGVNLDVKMRLRKRIPVKAGLGGGSSDAAAVLKALAPLCGIGKEKLLQVAGETGSDVPFFLTGGTALVRGRGDIISPIRTVPFHAVLVHPRVEVSTRDAYELWDLENSRYLTNTDMFQHYSVPSAEWHEGKPFPHDLRNDFLPLLAERVPEIGEVADFLAEKMNGNWGLSGSGSTFFALFRSPVEARKFAGMLRWNHSICVTVGSAGASSNG